MKSSVVNRIVEAGARRINPRDDCEVALPGMGLEARVHDMIREALAKMELSIPETCFPKVVIHEGKGSSHYKRSENLISLSANDVDVGDAYGEEIFHWLRHQCAPSDPREELTLFESKAVSEFFGFAGRTVLWRACAESEHAELLTPRRLSADTEGALESLKSIQESSEAVVRGCRVLDAWMSRLEPLECCREKLRDSLESILVEEAGSSSELLRKKVGSYLDESASALRALWSCMQNSGTEEAKASFWGLKIEELLEAHRALSAASRNIEVKSDEENGFEGGAESEEARGLFIEAALRFNRLLSVPCVKIREFQLQQTNALCSLTEASMNIQEHLAGYLSAEQFLEESKDPVREMGRLLKMSDGEILKEHIRFDANGVPL